MKENPIANAMNNLLMSPNCSDSNGEAANVVDGLFAIAEALESVATAINRLGMGNAATEMGAIENLAKELRDGFERIASS